MSHPPSHQNHDTTPSSNPTTASSTSASAADKLILQNATKKHTTKPKRYTDTNSCFCHQNSKSISNNKDLYIIITQRPCCDERAVVLRVRYERLLTAYPSWKRASYHLQSTHVGINFRSMRIGLCGSRGMMERDRGRNFGRRRVKEVLVLWDWFSWEYWRLRGGLRGELRRQLRVGGDSSILLFVTLYTRYSKSTYNRRAILSKLAYS